MSHGSICITSCVTQCSIFARRCLVRKYRKADFMLCYTTLDAGAKAGP